MKTRKGRGRLTVTPSGNDQKMTAMLWGQGRSFSFAENLQEQSGKRDEKR